MWCSDEGVNSGAQPLADLLGEREARHGSRDVVGSGSSCDGNHCGTAVLQLLQLHLLELSGVLGGDARRVEERSLRARNLVAVLRGFNNAANADNLEPELRVGLRQGLPRVRGGDVVGGESSDDFREDPAQEGEHGDAAVLELRLPQRVQRSHIRQAQGIERLAAGLHIVSIHLRQLRSHTVELGADATARHGGHEGGCSGEHGRQKEGAHGGNGNETWAGRRDDRCSPGAQAR
mmetsp:Transcript_8089/g.30387  ORF Transcript_8089/g.30387 Transcript_8089/m.30387 type:complete len:234 (+) Transcript_8089:199-900(+)